MFGLRVHIPVFLCTLVRMRMHEVERKHIETEICRIEKHNRRQIKINYNNLSFLFLANGNL